MHMNPTPQYISPFCLKVLFLWTVSVSGSSLLQEAAQELGYKWWLTDVISISLLLWALPIPELQDWCCIADSLFFVKAGGYLCLEDSSGVPQDGQTTLYLLTQELCVSGYNLEWGEINLKLLGYLRSSNSVFWGLKELRIDNSLIDWQGLFVFKREGLKEWIIYFQKCLFIRMGWCISRG